MSDEKNDVKISKESTGPGAPKPGVKKDSARGIHPPQVPRKSPGVPPQKSSKEFSPPASGKVYELGELDDIGESASTAASDADSDFGFVPKKSAFVATRPKVQVIRLNPTKVYFGKPVEKNDSGSPFAEPKPEPKKEKAKSESVVHQKPNIEKKPVVEKTSAVKKEPVKKAAAKVSANYPKTKPVRLDPALIYPAVKVGGETPFAEPHSEKADQAVEKKESKTRSVGSPVKPGQANSEKVVRKQNPDRGMDAKSQAGSKVAPKPKIDPPTKPKIESRPKMDPSAKPKTEAKPQVGSSTKPKTEAKSTVKPLAKPKTETKAKVEPLSKTKTDFKPKPGPLAKPKIEVEPSTKPEATAKVESLAKPKPEVKTKAESLTKPEMDLKPKVEPLAKPKMEPAPKPASEAPQSKIEKEPLSEKMEVLGPDNDSNQNRPLSSSNEQSKPVSKWAFWRRASKRDEQLAQISEGYLEMVDLVRAIRSQLESQNENNIILRDSLSHLPEAMDGLTSFSKSQHTVGQALKEIHGQMKQYSSKDEKLVDSMDGFNSTLKGMDDTSKATMRTFDRVQERMRDSDIRMENLVKNVQSTEEKVSDTMMRLQQNMARMQTIFLACLLLAIVALILTLFVK